MKPNDYEFNIGDKVVTVYGEVGRIVDICKCEKCGERGFFEPTWTEDGADDKQYISVYMANYGFLDFRQIGKYLFNNPFSKTMVKLEVERLERDLDIWKKRLAAIEELEKEA